MQIMVVSKTVSINLSRLSVIQDYKAIRGCKTSISHRIVPGKDIRTGQEKYHDKPPGTSL